MEGQVNPHRRFLFILTIFAALAAGVMADDPPEYRAFYAATFDINTQAKCDAIISHVLANNINAVFVEVRGRADAYYYPNREDSTYPNSEPRGQLYAISPSDLDVLQYFIDRLHAATPRVEVHAWCTTFNTWNRSTAPSASSHVYNAHPEWITENSAGTTYTYSDDAPLDPGIPAVQDHVYNVFMDIVRNYDVDGIHFDYIRLLSSNSGYDPVALAQFQAETGFSYNPASPGSLSEVYKAWRRDQISQLVQRVSTQVSLEKPWVEVSAFLVNFSDSVEVLGQGYNWWVAHEAIDVLHPGCYSSSVSGTVDDWNFYVGKLAQNGNQNTRPLVCAVGSYLMTAAENTTAINNIRGNARTPDGFNFFDYGALFVDGTPATEIGDAIFGTGGPMDDWAPIPAMPHKPDEETTPPNAPASASVSLVGGTPRITFSRPAAAGDGDLPVHYRLYRDSNATVDLYYDNMAMEWWDTSSSRTSFSFDDVAAPGGTTYYSVVAYDDWNNQASVTIGPVAPTGSEYIIETRSGGLNFGDYSESGTFSDSTATSTAPGLTTDLGSRFALPGDANGRNDRARFTPSGMATGTYDVYVTTHQFSSANAQDITVRIDGDGPATTSTYDLTVANAGNTWDLVGTINFTSGQGQFVEFDNATQSNIGGSTDSRMAACALRFVSGGGTPTPKEPFPGVSAPLSGIIEVIADSEPTALDYDDSGSWASTTYSPSGTLHEGSSRYYAAGSFPLDDYAVWVIDLPQAGRWAIDGWIRNEQGSLAQGVQYRFVDGYGTVHSTTATQQTGSGGWTINVDGVADGDAHDFEEGRVYVTLYGNTTGSQLTMADAIRFRLVEAVGVGLSGFVAE